MARRAFNPDAPLQSINNTAYITGESRSAIRAGVKAGRIPHCKRGSGTNAIYLINLPLYLRMLDEESMTNVREAKKDGR